MMGVAMLLAGLIIQVQTAPEDLKLIGLARSAVVAEVNHRTLPIPDSSTEAKAVFVTIEIRDQVRGCRGGLETHTHSLEEEVICAARSASRHDPRYRPLQPSDTKDFKVTVTIVDHIEPIDDIIGLRAEEGLVLKSGDRTGIVLPFEGRDPTTRMHWAFRKAGVLETAQAQKFRMIARRFRG